VFLPRDPSQKRTPVFYFLSPAIVNTTARPAIPGAGLA